MSIFSKLQKNLSTIAKFIKRSYVDIEFCLNNFVLQAKNNEVTVAPNSVETFQSTLKNI